MRKLFGKTALLLALLMVLPFIGLAADPESNEGTFKIDVIDRYGHSTVGNWYLHQGGSNGLVLRNGSSSEEFNMDAGNYFLEVRLTKDYKAYDLEIEPFQSLSVGETVTYTLRYYADEEELLEGPITPLTSEESQPEASEPVQEPVEEPAPQPVQEPVVTVASDVPEFNEAPAPMEIEIAAASDTTVEPPQLAVTGFPALALIFPSVAGGLLAVRRRRKF